LEIGSVRRAPARFPPWTIQVQFELSALTYSGDIRKELEKTEENEPNLSFLAQTLQKWRPVEVKK
jgi:hypothetical protein